jgi:nitrite reductase/ring-hydroxylating ferredoxin subunit/uncharacterized membrane protein
MRSKANIKGHPIHPILIPFPLAFLIGALFFDILGFLKENESFLTTGRYLTIAGIFSALGAAVPGIMDYISTVPPKSSAKKRATKHGLVNSSAVVLFTISLFLKNGTDNFLVILVLEGVGLVLLGVGGWMGGTLSYRNQIGVDIRYANAGKWKELTVEGSSGEFEIAATNELKVNHMKLIKIGNKRIVLGKSENGLFAFDDFCTHKGGSLAGGALICGTVQCPWHGSQFDIENGKVKAGPAKERIVTYKTKEKDGKVYLII